MSNKPIIGSISPLSPFFDFQTVMEIMTIVVGKVIISSIFELQFLFLHYCKI